MLVIFCDNLLLTIIVTIRILSFLSYSFIFFFLLFYFSSNQTNVLLYPSCWVIFKSMSTFSLQLQLFLYYSILVSPFQLMFPYIYIYIYYEREKGTQLHFPTSLFCESLHSSGVYIYILYIRKQKAYKFFFKIATV